MARMPSSARAGFLCDSLSAWEAAADGVTVATNAGHKKYWKLWSAYKASATIDPFLDPATVPPRERDIIAGAFATGVRTGRYGQGNTFKFSRVSETLASISKTIEFTGKPGQLYRSENTYQLFLERMMEGFRRNDPPNIPQLDVPVTIPKTAYNVSLVSK